MNTSLFWGGGFVAIVAAIAAVNAQTLSENLSRFWDRYLERVRFWTDRLYLVNQPERQAKYIAAVAVVIGVLLTVLEGPVVGTGVGGLVLFGPFLWYRTRWQRRCQRFDEQVIDAILSMANSLRAGLVLPQSMEVVVDNMPAPISQELGTVLKEYHLGLSLEEGLGRLGERVKSERYNVVLSSLMIARRSGGDLARVLDDTAKALKEIARLEGRIKSTTAQGKLQVMVMGLMPPVFMAVVYQAQPSLVIILWRDPIGYAILGAIVLLEVIGIALARKILLTEV